MSIMYRNINDRRKAEEAVRESEQLQSALFAQAATGLMLTSASGHFVRVNAEIIRLLGYSEQEMLGLSITDICFAEDSADDQAVAVKLLSGEVMNYKSQRRYRHKNGDAIFVSAQGNIIRDAQGNVANFIISVQDLTEAKHAEQKLIQASKMSSLGEMAGSIAHEINSPLTVIALSAEQLEMAAMDETVDADSVARISGRITETVNRITKIIRGLKSFSRNAELDPMVVTTLSSLVGDTLELCREKFRYKGVDLRVGAIPDVNLICRPTELSQVLLNLLNNAFDAVENAEANQSQRWVQVAVRVEGEWVSLTVTDSGTGIPETIASRMLEPFYTTKELGKGTGLGLSISKGIIETHGGQLYYDRSNPNTSFVVELKLAPSNVSSILKPDNDNASGY